MKRRIYWGAFVDDKLQSLFLSQPFAMHECTGNATHVYLDSFEEMEDWTPYINHAQPVNVIVPLYRGRQSRAISTFQSLLQSCKIIGYIIDAFYSVESLEKSESGLLQTKHLVTSLLTSRWSLLGPCYPD